MVKVGDMIVATKKGVDWYGWEMVVTDINPSKIITQYLSSGNYIKAEDQFGTSYLLKENEYNVKEQNEERSLRVYPIKRDNGTQQPFYYAIEDTGNYVSFYDDCGSKRNVPKDHMKEFTSEDTLEGIYQLSKESNKLKQAYIETAKMIRADVDVLIDKLKEN